MIGQIVADAIREESIHAVCTEHPNAVFESMDNVGRASVSISPEVWANRLAVGAEWFRWQGAAAPVSPDEAAELFTRIIRDKCHAH